MLSPANVNRVPACTSIHQIAAAMAEAFSFAEPSRVLAIPCWLSLRCLHRTMAVEVEYWPTFDATMLIGHASREQILQAYRDVRDQLFSRIKQRFGLEGGPTV